ncbi:hypothetical protein WMY93_033843 [Mugilogobius chulae]|uniref:Uncharacterized protein n=1 Tax=Mugilogobius chulae TaxID=88201 RepID=A0AAW0MSK2_9GOBI
MDCCRRNPQRLEAVWIVFVKRGKPLSASVFRYTFNSAPADSLCVCFSRRKNVLSREKLKLLFKQHCEPQNGAIGLKVCVSSTTTLIQLPPKPCTNTQTPIDSPIETVRLSTRLSLPLTLTSLVSSQASSVSKFGLLDLNFTQFFPDEPPVFSPALTPPPGARRTGVQPDRSPAGQVRCLAPPLTPPPGAGGQEPGIQVSVYPPLTASEASRTGECLAPF